MKNFIILSLIYLIPFNLNAQYFQIGTGIGCSYYKSNQVFTDMNITNDLTAIDYDFFVRWQPKGKWALELGFGNYMLRKYDETYTAVWADNTGILYNNYVHEKNVIFDHQWNTSIQYQVYSSKSKKISAYLGLSFTTLSEYITQSGSWYHIDAPVPVHFFNSNVHYTFPYYGALLKVSYKINQHWAANAVCQYRTKWSHGYPLYSSGDLYLTSLHVTPNAYYTCNFGICYALKYKSK